MAWLREPVPLQKIDQAGTSNAVAKTDEDGKVTFPEPTAVHAVEVTFPADGEGEKVPRHHGHSASTQKQ